MRSLSLQITFLAIVAWHGVEAVTNADTKLASSKATPISSIVSRLDHRATEYSHSRRPNKITASVTTTTRSLFRPTTNQSSMLLLQLRGGAPATQRRRWPLPEPIGSIFANTKRAATKLPGISNLQRKWRRLRQKPLTLAKETTPAPKQHKYDPLAFYMRCMGIVLVWISSGTLFYSYYNQWPIPQSFFYAVDAGMSIGFCTEVYETKLASKAFTIAYILLGASVIGGALALFIQDLVEGLARTPANRVDEYQILLERDVFNHADIDHTGALSFSEFEGLIQSMSLLSPSTTPTRAAAISADDVKGLWNKFDRLNDGVIRLEEFTATFRGIDQLVQSLHQETSMHPLRRLVWKIGNIVQKAWQLEHRIYVAFVFWIALGVTWGMVDQGWDVITATHFAVSALATGGLTAPEVNADGILPAGPAIFCGIYCLVGIPLFALTLGHYARVLVSGQVAALEREALTRPMTKQEFELASHLTTQDDVVHLSDFIVLQLLRQGKLTAEAVQVMKEHFEALDSNRSGTLSLGQAVAVRPSSSGN